MILLASTTPLIWKTHSHSILKKYPVSYICRFRSFTLIMNKASKFLFTKQLFLQNNNSLVSDNSTDTHLSGIFKNVVTAHTTFMSLMIYTTIPTIFSSSSNIHPIQFIHATTTTTPTCPTILNKIPFIPIINGPVNWRIWWKLMSADLSLLPGREAW